MQTKINLSENNGIRTGLDRYERPCVVAKDIATILEYEDSSNMLRMVAEKDKGTAMVSTPNGNRKMSILYPSGLLSILERSAKSKARELGRWFESEMMKSIQKIGKTDNGFVDNDQMSKRICCDDYDEKMKFYLSELNCILLEITRIRKTFKPMPSIKDPFPEYIYVGADF